MLFLRSNLQNPLWNSHLLLLTVRTSLSRQTNQREILSQVTKCCIFIHHAVFAVLQKGFFSTVAFGHFLLACMMCEISNPTLGKEGDCLCVCELNHRQRLDFSAAGLTSMQLVEMLLHLFFTAACFSPAAVTSQHGRPLL